MNLAEKLIALSELFQVSLDYLLKDYLGEESERPPAEGCDRDWGHEERRRREGQKQDDSWQREGKQKEDNLRLEKKVDELTRYIKGFQYTSKTKIMGIPLVSIRFSRHLGNCHRRDSKG